MQKIALVQHPERNQELKPGYEKLRQPKDTLLELSDLAAYFSAYYVDDGMINDLEALMVRGFANDLLNVRMETGMSGHDVGTVLYGSVLVLRKLINPGGYFSWVTLRSMA